MTTPVSTVTESHASDAQRGLEVTAQPFMLPDDSSPINRRFMFGYRMTIRNNGDDAAQLMDRHWIIIDADGKTEEVRGPGVIGETPIIEAGHQFSYTSFCPLTTEWGTMEGSYGMRTPDGQRFEVAIPRFFLVWNDAQSDS